MAEGWRPILRLHPSLPTLAVPGKSLWNTRGSTAPGLKTPVSACLQIMGPGDLCFDFPFRVKSWERAMQGEDAPPSRDLSLKPLGSDPAGECQR